MCLIDLDMHIRIKLNRNSNTIDREFVLLIFTRLII